MEEGDYRIETENKILAVIERKTLNDYASSIKDNRHDNRFKMLNLRESTGCKVYYLVEGPLHPKYSTVYQGITYSKILSSIRKLEIRDDIHVIRSKNMTDTAEQLRFLCEVYSGMKDDLQIKGGEENGLTKKEILLQIKPTKEEKIDTALIKIWSSQKGISVTTAKVLSREFTLAECINKTLDFDRLGTIKINARKLSKNIIASLSSFDENKLLAAYPGISPATAFKLLNEKTMSELINPDNIELNSNIIINKKKIGRKKIESIINISNSFYKFEVDNPKNIELDAETVDNEIARDIGTD